MKYLWFRFQCWLNFICPKHHITKEGGGDPRGGPASYCLVCAEEKEAAKEKRIADLIERSRRVNP